LERGKKIRKTAGLVAPKDTKQSETLPFRQESPGDKSRGEKAGAVVVRQEPFTFSRA